MSSYETNPHYFIGVIYSDHQTIFIAFNVEDNPVVLEDVCRGIFDFNVTGTLPLSIFGFFVP